MLLVSLYQEKVYNAGKKMLGASRGLARGESSCGASRTSHLVRSSSLTFPRGSLAEQRKPGAAARWQNSIGSHASREAGVRRALRTCRRRGRGVRLPGRSSAGIASAPAAAPPGGAVPAPQSGRAGSARCPRLNPPTPGRGPAPTPGIQTLPGDVSRLVPEPHLEVLPGLFQPRGDPSR